MGHQVKKLNKRRITEIRGKTALYRKCTNTSAHEFVLIAMRVHLFPSRTQKLSSFAPTIVAGWLAVKIGNANTRPWPKGRGFSSPETCHRHVSWRQRIVALAMKTGNGNTKGLTERSGLFFAWNMPPACFLTAKDSCLSCENRNLNYHLHKIVEVFYYT